MTQTPGLCICYRPISVINWKRALVIDAQVSENFAVAARNIATIDVLPSVGANVYDILKSDTLVLTKAGVEVDRKVMADLAVHEPEAFGALVEKAKGALAA